jgi:hypothetical protein
VGSISKPRLLLREYTHPELSTGTAPLNNEPVILKSYTFPPTYNCSHFTGVAVIPVSSPHCFD